MVKALPYGSFRKRGYSAKSGKYFSAIKRVAASREMALSSRLVTVL
jgi:hypothetical protein